MRDPKAGRYDKDRECREAFAIARRSLPSSAQPGLRWSVHDYEAFRYEEGADVRLIFYRHRTSARNYHVRVRDGGSRNKARADALMSFLEREAGPNCTFRRKLR